MKQLQLTFLFLLPIVLFSQSWDIELGSSYLLNGNQLQTIESRFPKFTESGLSYQTIIATYRFGPIYSNRASLSIGGGWTKEISSRFSFRLGGGLFVRSLDRLDNFDPTSRQVIIEETSSFSSLLKIIGDCEFVSVSPAELGESNLTVNYLTFSASTIYEVVDEKFSLTAGVEYRRPLSQPTQQVLDFDREEELGEVTCTFHRDEVDNPDYINENNFALNIGGIYKVNEKWNLELGVSRDLNNIFRSLFPAELRATELFLKVRYQF